MKPFYKSRTFWIACLQGIVGVTAVLINIYPEVGVLVVMKSILDIVLRVQTTERVTLK